MMLSGYSEEEIKKWAILRALEWGNWPVFIMQPIAPILMLYFEWWVIAVLVFALNLFWSLVRYRFVSPGLVHYGAMFVHLKWPISIGLSVYFYSVGNTTHAVAALSWPLISLLLMSLRIWIRLGPTNLGLTERMLLQKMGFIPYFEDD